MSFRIGLTRSLVKDQDTYQQIYLAGIMKSILITLGDALTAIEI